MLPNSPAPRTKRLAFPYLSAIRLYAGNRHGRSLGLVFDELVMHQVLAHQVNVEMRILHPPDLAGFQELQSDSTFLIHYYPTVRVSEQNKEGNANRTRGQTPALIPRNNPRRLGAWARSITATTWIFSGGI